MDIRFKTGKKPIVRFAKSEVNAAELLIGTLREYGNRLGNEDASQGADRLEKLAFAVGLFDAPATAE